MKLNYIVLDVILKSKQIRKNKIMSYVIKYSSNHQQYLDRENKLNQLFENQL